MLLGWIKIMVGHQQFNHFFVETVLEEAFLQKRFIAQKFMH